MSGLQKLLKAYGQMKVGTITWAWDYATDTPRILSEMSKAERAASERARLAPKSADLSSF